MHSAALFFGGWRDYCHDVSVHAGQHLKHDQRHQKHGEEADDPSDITVAEFKDAHSPQVPLSVVHVHPNQTGVAKHIEGVNEGYGQQQRPNPAFPRKVEHGDGPDEEHHRLERRAGENKIDPDQASIGEQEFGLEGIFTGEIGGKPSVSVPVLPRHPSGRIVDPGRSDVDVLSGGEAEEPCRLGGYEPNRQDAEIGHVGHQHVRPTREGHRSSCPHHGLFLLPLSVRFPPCGPAGQGECQRTHHREDHVVVLKVHPGLIEEIETNHHPPELRRPDALVPSSSP